MHVNYVKKVELLDDIANQNKKNRSPLNIVLFLFSLLIVYTIEGRTNIFKGYLMKHFTLFKIKKTIVMLT